ncbi:hypothetical protein BDV95DRAFT_594793 [Massariosphaeria phaeospora]|uniref:Uncharacterized protein n=1 Tax=Massariosphaeria phaeospora TaxID=100035 RepID=A0A7C8I634_9PLEO|nr:hypothetical protein BDV95DRAFT_594793 [Massariosphaeria phaeospora]
MHESFLGTSYFAKLPLDDQRRCYHVLVGQEPPPTMELTTPPPGSRTLNTAAVRVARPRISTHVSSPALHTAMQQTPAYLGPLRSEQPNSSLHPTGPHVLQAHAVPIYSSVGRDGHPRYRPVSAPNAPSANQNPSPKTNVTNGSRPDLVQPQAPQQQTHKPVYVAARVVEVKTVHNRVQTQMVSSHSSGPSMGNPPRKPMPNSNVGYMVHGQSSAPAPLGAPFQVQTAAPVRSATAVATTGVRSSHNPIPQKSQQGAHNAPSHVSSSNIGPRPVEPYRISQATSAGVRPQARASSHTHQHISNSVDTHASAQPQYNNVEHSRHTSPGLKLVGPQGVYTSPPKPAQPIQSAPHIPPTQTYQSSSHPAQPFTHQTQQLPTRSLNEDAASQAHLQQPVAPLPVGNPQARAAPPQGLPASLMIGGSRPQRHSTSQPRQVNGVPMLLTSHQGYYSPPSSAPNSTHPSPQAKPASVAGYKAYSVPISPPMPPATAPAKLQHPPPMLHMEAAMAPAQHVTSQYGVPSVPVAARQTSPARDPHAYHVNTSSSVLPTPAYNHHTSHTETTMTAGATMVTAAAIPTAGYGAHFYTTNEQTTTHIHHENYANHPHHMPSELPASTPTPPLLQLQSPFLRDAALAIAETPSSAYQTPIDWQQVPAPLQTKLRLSIQPQLSVQTHQHNDNQAAAPADSPSASDDFTPTHQRNISLESHSSEELAAEYRLELPDSGDMFKSPIELVEGGLSWGVGMVGVGVRVGVSRWCWGSGGWRRIMRGMGMRSMIGDGGSGRSLL